VLHAVLGISGVMHHEKRAKELQRIVAELEQQKQEQEQQLKELQRALAELEQQKQGQEQLLREGIKLPHAALGISGDNE
jgi:TolA-binding protein